MLRKTSNQLFLNWFGILDQYAWSFLFFPLILCILLASGLSSLTENNDGRIFFDEASQERQQLLALEQRFTETNSILLVLSVDKGDVFALEPLKAILEVTDLAWKMPYVTRVNSLSNYQRILSAQDDLIIEDLFTEDNLNHIESIAEIREYAVSEKDLVGQILSQDGKTTAVVLNMAAPRGDSVAIKVIMAEVAAIKKKIENKTTGLSLYITGDIPLDNAFADAYAYDLQYLFPLFLLAIFLVCYFFFKSILLSAVILSMMIMVVAATMGSAGYLDIDLSAGTSGVPIILITISLADFIHLLSAMRLAMRAGLDRNQAVQKAIKNNFLPISLTSFTTFIGFISLNFSEAPPFRDLGNLVAIGIVISYLITFTFFPIFLVKIKLENVFKGKASRISASPEFILYISETLVRKRKMVAAVVISGSIVICAGLTKIEFDDDWVKYFDQDNSFRRDTEFVVRHLTGVDTIEYMLSAEKGRSITDVDFLNRLDEFESWALAQPQINHVASIVPLFKKMHFHMNRKTETEEAEIVPTLANNSDLNAQYLLLYEMSLPVGLDLNDRIDIAKEATRLTVTARNLTSRQMRALDSQLSDKLKQMDLIKAHGSGTGIPLMFAGLSKRNIQSMLSGIAFALVVVSVVITVSFKSLKLGLLSFVVNILPIILGFGIWGWFYHTIGVSLTIVAAIAFGIVVDDSIHFITKYKKEIDQKNDDIVGALKATFAGVGGALVMTTSILVIGFIILSFSVFQPTWGLGLISVIMISIALLFDFLLLPAFLVLFDSGPNKKIE